MNGDFRDSQWDRDYQAALDELNGKAPRRLLLPAPAPHKVEPQPVSSFNVKEEAEELGPIVPGDFESGAALREALLARVLIRKTTDSHIKEVFYLGELVGKIARSPYQAMCWLNEAERVPYYSAADASLGLLRKRLAIFGGAA